METPLRSGDGASQRGALNRRVSQRYPRFDDFLKQYAFNLSMVGMFVEMAEPYEAGTPVEIDIRLSSGVQLIGGEGWVAWARPAARGQTAGAGIEFASLTATSRRLIRWLLRRNTFGYKAFVLSDQRSAGRMLKVTEDPARRAGGWWRWAPVGLLGIAAILVVLNLLLQREPAGTGVADGPKVERTVAAAVEAAPVVEQETELLEMPQPEAPEATEDTVPSSSPDPPPVEETQRPETSLDVVSSVMAWAEAWSNQDVETYLASYADRFEPPNGLTLDRWRRQRRQRVGSPSNIRVDIDQLEVLAEGADSATVTFEQIYTSDRFSDVVRKTLTMVHEGGRWKIAREQSE